MLNENGMPIKGNGDDGDSMLWAGLMTAVGDNGPTEGIKMCQSPDGRLWRSVKRVGKDGQNSFSRDQALGFILYFSKTKDKEMADKWISYLRKIGSLFPASESTDTRHLITPALWWLMSYAGMQVPWYYTATRWLIKPYHKIEMRFAPAGYQTHLQGITSFILALSTGKRDIADGKYLHSREPSNAFFAWLAGKNDAAQSISNTYRHMHDSLSGSGTQWCWERTDSDEAWRDSMEWDFLFIDKLCTLDIR